MKYDLKKIHSSFFICGGTPHQIYKDISYFANEYYWAKGDFLR
jgi:hypothetical protein